MGMAKNRTLDFMQHWKAGLPMSASSASVQASKRSPPPPPPPFSLPCNFLGSFSSSFLRRRMAFSFTLRMRKNSSLLAQPCVYERECGGKEGSSIIHRLFAQRRCGRHIRTRGGMHLRPPPPIIIAQDMLLRQWANHRRERPAATLLIPEQSFPAGQGVVYVQGVSTVGAFA